MGKVSIGLRGWRFDEEDVFTDDGQLRPVDLMPDDVERRVLRLHALVEAPCDACWFVHGDEHIDRCNVARVVYGEPFSEVVLCNEHEPDFLYWYFEEGGSEYAGTDEFEDRFHAWYRDGNAAPEDYEGIEHVDTDPDDVPTPDAPTACEFAPDDVTSSVDPSTAESGDVDADPVAGPAAETDAAAGTSADADGDVADEDDDFDLDLSMDYPTK